MATITLLALGLTAVTTLQTPNYDRYVYPLAREQAAPKVSVNVKEAPDLQAWGETAARLTRAWYPIVCSLLATERYRGPQEIRLVFRAKQDAPAWASGGEISINAEWVRAHPDDLGMVIHELTHVIQGYPDNKVDTGWLVEGIADYIRWWRYEPEAPRPRIDREKASYKDAYRTTAAFLAWASRKYDMRLVPALDRALRRGADPSPLWFRFTGKDVDALWKEFVSA